MMFEELKKMNIRQLSYYVEKCKNNPDPVLDDYMFYKLEEYEWWIKEDGLEVNPTFEDLNFQILTIITNFMYFNRYRLKDQMNENLLKSYNFICRYYGFIAPDWFESVYKRQTEEEAKFYWGVPYPEDFDDWAMLKRNTWKKEVRERGFSNIGKTKQFENKQPLMRTQKHDMF